MRVLADAHTVDEAYPQILEGICRALDWQVGVRWVVSPSPHGDRLRCAEVWRRGDDPLSPFERASRALLFERGIGLPGRVWENRRAEWISDVVQDRNFPRANVAAESDLHGAVGFPIVVNGDIFAVMEFFSHSALEPDDGLLGTLERIGIQIGHFVEREQLGRRLVFHAALLESQGEAAIDGILVVSTDDKVLYSNRRFLEIWDVPEELVEPGRDRRPVVERKARLAVDPDYFKRITLAVFDDPEASRRDEIALADGRVIDRWTAPVKGPDGSLLGRAMYYRDVTTQKRTEQRLRENERWYSFLAEVSSVMSQTLDYRANLNRLARMAVPMLADWCAIHIVDDQGDIEPVALAHSDPNRLSLAQRLQETFPVDPSSEIGLAAAVNSGTPLLFEEIRDDVLESVAPDAEQFAQLRSLGFTSAMVVPLVCRDRVLGTLTLLASDSGRRYTKEDLRLAEDLAARVAFPIDNVRLYEQHSRVAQTLQESLLPPELPEIPGIEVAARYHAVMRTADVGGDFYDVFPAGERSWGVALGDVSGKGVEAAAVTSLARHTLRAATMASQRPSEILSVLNAALLDQTDQDRFCTAVYALVEPRFGHVNVTVSCGGHPLPYVVRSNGAIEAIAAEGTLLGVVADPQLTDISVELDFGDKLILYTDGILDVRPRDSRFGQPQLEQLFAACAKRGANSAADLIERRVLELQEGQARDDFALMIFGVRTSIFRRVRSPRLWARGTRDDDALS
ncbi:MAG TPA: SpoIIE family protein phosphatase [Actinomycetota bacterium]|nr:SpoIIE family protein phosphatase [Actinomycetota bacterium]